MWLFLIQNIYAGISLTFYLIICWLVIRERRYFSPTFVKLFITLAVFNICSYTTMYLIMRAPKEIGRSGKLGYFLENFPCPKLLRVAIFCGFYFSYCQQLSLFFIIFHRMRAITWPFDREAIWDTHYWVTLVFICLFPLSFTYTLLVTDVRYVYKHQIGGFLLSAVDIHARDELLQLTIFSCVVTVLSVLANATSIIMLCKRSMSSNYRRELNLFLISFLGFLVQALHSAVAAGLYIYEPDTTLSYIFVNALPYCNDFFCLGIPYFVLVFNVRIKKCFFELPPCMNVANFGVRHKCDKACQHLTPCDGSATMV